MAAAAAQAVKAFPDQIRSGLEHSYAELVASDMTLSAMNDAERSYVLELAQSHDLAALQVVFRSMLEDAAKTEKGERQLLDVARRVRIEQVIATYGAQNELAIRSAMMKADMVEADLLSEASASPLERLLIGRIVTCWLACELADIDAAKQEEGHYPNQSNHVADYYAKRQDRAHKRFLQAVEALNRMRRYLSPLPLVAGQVNIATPGSQQVNMVR